MLPAGFESEIPSNKRPHTHALGHTITGIGSVTDNPIKRNYILQISGLYGAIPGRILVPVDP
jgi:hypothetical protein